MTYKLVTLEISAAAFREIKLKLIDAGYEHAFEMENGQVAGIQMHHIRLVDVGSRESDRIYVPVGGFVPAADKPQLVGETCCDYVFFLKQSTAMPVPKDALDSLQTLGVSAEQLPERVTPIQERLFDEEGYEMTVRGVNKL